MDMKHYSTKILNFLKKYKYAFIVLLIGIALMLMPGISGSNSTVKQNQRKNEVYTKDLDGELADILCKVEGAGRVEVILTIAKGEETIYQTNSSRSSDEHGSDIKIDTVIISNSSRNETGLIMRIDPVKYLGAIVLCQGADRPAVRLAITEAVSKITGLGSDRICVLKMK